MPFKSEAQRRFMWAKHPEVAERWAHEYPHQKKLPKHVKKAFDLGVNAAFEAFGLKLGGEEIRLKIPTREFHGFDAAFNRAASKADDKTKKAEDQDDEVTMPLPQQASDEQPVEKLVKLLQALPDPKGTNIRETNALESDSQGWTSPQPISMNETPSTGTTF
jgi:hypothetical protein